MAARGELPFDYPSAAAEAARALPRIRVGIAGWSYPDWRGVVYPARRPREFSELRFVARYVDCVEINSTFYRIPEPRFAERWRAETDDVPGFLFTAKLFQELTHGTLERPEMVGLARLYAEGVAPLAEAGRLGCVLLQFPWYFEDGPKARERLAILAEALAPLPLAVEIRHRSFLTTGDGGALPFLESLGFHFVNIDFPRARTSPPPTALGTGDMGYFRLHGRNADAWYDPKAGRNQKYDYLYSPEELRALVEPIQRVSQGTRITFVITNNHFRGQGFTNALQLQALLSADTGRERPPPPPDLVRAYPVLRDSR